MNITSPTSEQQTKEQTNKQQQKLDTSHTRGYYRPLTLSRREQTTGQTYQNVAFKNVKIVKFSDHIWNNHEQCIQMSTNMPSIGSIICQIGFRIEKI